MKKTVMLIVLVLAVLSSFSVTFATESVYSRNTEWIETDQSADNILWYYAPNFTKLNPQGRLETWVKYKNPSGEYTISHEFVAPNFDKYMETESNKFRSDGSLKEIHIIRDAKWKDIPPGSPFEQCLQAALAYAKK